MGLKNPFLPAVKWTAKRLSKLDKATKRFASSIGLTKSTVPDIVLWPFRKAAYGIAVTLKTIENAVRWLWGATFGRVIG